MEIARRFLNLDGDCSLCERVGMLEFTEPDNTKKEAITQAELYILCKEVGLCCDLEHGVDLKQGCRPDLVVVVGNQIIAIVEVKRYASFGHLSERSKKQIKRYRGHDVPVFILYSIYDIPYLVKQLLKLKTKFLESMDSAQIKCFEADKQNEEKWNTKIAAAFNEFNETFSDYKFTNQQSLEIIAIGVKVLGLADTLKLMDEFKSDLKVFFSMLDAQISYRKTSRERFLNTRKGSVQSISTYQNRQDRIDEKLS